MPTASWFARMGLEVSSQLVGQAEVADFNPMSNFACIRSVALPEVTVLSKTGATIL